MAALPDVTPGQRITSQHINAIKNSVSSWLSDTDAKGFTLKNAKFDAASKAAAQTPWGQDIDATNFDLKNVHRLRFNNTVDLSLELFRAGATVFGMGIEPNTQYYQAASGGLHRWYCGTPDGGATDVMELSASGLAISNAVTGLGGLFTPSDIGINRDASGKRIWAGPAAFFRMDPTSTGNIFMALYPNGAAGTVCSDGVSFPLNFQPGVRMGIGAWNLPKVQVDSDQFHARYIVQPGDFAHSWNLDVSGGQWRHVANGYGNVITGSLGDGNLRVYTTNGSGAAGAVASLRAVAYFGSQNIRFATHSVFMTGQDGGSNPCHAYCPWDNPYSWRFGVGMLGDASRYFIARYDDSGNWLDDPLNIYRSNGNVNVKNILTMQNSDGERIRVYDSGALGTNHAIGVEANCMWQTSNANFRWYVATPPDNGQSATMSLYPAHLRLQASSEFDLDFFCYAGAADRKFSRITTIPGKIGLELVNDAYNAILCSLSLNAGWVLSDVPIIGRANVGSNLDVQAGAAWSWYLYAISNTQIAIRIRGNDGTYRQVVLNVA